MMQALVINLVVFKHICPFPCPRPASPCARLYTKSNYMRISFYLTACEKNNAYFAVLPLYYCYSLDYGCAHCFVAFIVSLFHQRFNCAVFILSYIMC